MATILLYIGIALIVAGWLSLSWLAARRIQTQKELERLPQRREELKRSYANKRWACRAIILLGMVVLILSLII